MRTTENNYFRFVLITFGIALFVVSGCSTKNVYSSPDQATELIADKQINNLNATEDFGAIFEEPATFASRKLDSGYDLTPAVTKFIRQCCDDREEALSLLRENGFKVSKNIVDAFADESAKYDYRKQGYDEVYGAEKQTKFHPIYPVYINNQVTIFISQGSIREIAAFSFHDGL